jgi:hypothetical protein
MARRLLQHGIEPAGLVGQRLFAENMLAGRERGAGDRRMRGVIGADRDQVDIGGGQLLMIVGGCPGDFIRRRQRAGPGWIQIAGPGQMGLVGMLAVTGGMGWCNHTTANNANADRFHRGFARFLRRGQGS